MGTIINLGDIRYSYSERKRANNHNGLLLTNSGWKNFKITKHRRDVNKWGWGQNKCAVCGCKCYRSLGNKYEQICLKCSTEFIDNSVAELNKMITKLKEQKEYINNNMDKLMREEAEQFDKWDKELILNKLEDEQ